MDNTTPAAFHCPSCGALSKAGANDGGEVVCGECGYEFRKPIRVAPRGAAARVDPRGRFVQRDVVSRRRLHARDQVAQPMVQPVEPAAAPETPEESGPENSRHREEVILEDGTRKVMKRRKKKRSSYGRSLFFMAFWIVLAAVLVIGVKEFIKRDHQPVEETEKEKAKRLVEAKEAQVRTFLNEHLMECRQNLAAFFEAPDTASRAQFVRERVRVTPRMASYYQNNIAMRPSDEFILVSSGLKMMGEEPGIETVWEVDDGKLIEVVFVREKSEWVIDWEEFVRYGSVPWHRFVDGVEREGEFRVYLRKRQVLTESDKVFGVQFYPALEDSALRQRGESPRVLVRVESELGRRLALHWDTKIEEPGVGDTMFNERDPEGLSRVRVALAWVEGNDGDYMELRELISGAWWGDGFQGTLDDFVGGEEPAEPVEEGSEESEEEVED